MPDSIIKADNISSLSGGGIGFPDGSVSNPSMKFTNDGDTGLYRIGNNTIGIASNGTRVGEIGNGYGGFTGNIIQVQNIIKSDVFSTTSGTYVVISGLSLSITPRYVSSKILVISNVKVGVAQDSYPQVALFVNGNRFPSEGTYSSFNNISNSIWLNEFGFNYLHSPNSTSSVTYEVRILINNDGTVYVNRYGNDVNRISSSSLTLLEVQQ